MKTFIAFFAALLYSTAAIAQTADTLEYDGISNVFSQPLYAVTDYEVEAEVCHTVRFTPAARCKVTHLIAAGSIVRFNSFGGSDTLVVTLYDDMALPLKNIYRTWQIDMGMRGFPDPNITSGNPLNQPWKGIMVLPLDPPPIIAPERDFLLGIALKPRQSYEIGEASFHGLTLSVKDNAPEFERYRRYQAFVGGQNGHEPVGPTARYALYLRAVVQYDASLPDTEYTGLDDAPGAASIALDQNYPNPFSARTSIGYTLGKAGFVSLDVYDMLGRKAASLVDARQEPGMHTAAFDVGAHHLAPGLYVLRLRQGGLVRTRNMFLMK